MTQRIKRARRSQLSVPGSSEKMLQKGAESAADHVFCDLEDAVAPSAKVEARDKIAWALNNLDWGRKTRCVRINDVTPGLRAVHDFIFEKYGGCMVEPSSRYNLFSPAVRDLPFIRSNYLLSEGVMQSAIKAYEDIRRQ